MLCDGISDCPNGEDEYVPGNERACTEFNCSGLLRCRSDNICVHPMDICDGVTHCSLSGDDEKHCHFGTCPYGCLCRGSAVKCNKIENLKKLYYRTVALILHQHYLNERSSLNHFENMIYLEIQNCRFFADIIQLQLFSTMPNVLTLLIIESGVKIVKPNSFNHMTKLQDIDLSLNQIHSISAFTFRGLLSLDNLNFNHFHLTELSEFSFHGLTALRHLDLSFNNITAIEHMTFAGLEHIQTIDLRQNMLVFMQTLIIGSMQHVKIYFDDTLYCCSLTKHQSCIINNSTYEASKCNLAFTITSTITYNITFSCFVIFCVLTIFIYQRCTRKSSIHALILEHLALSNLLLSGYLILLSITLSFYKDDFIYMNTRWMQSYWCSVLGVLFFLGFVGSKLLMSLMVLQQLIVVKFVFSGVALSGHALWYIGLLWIGILTAASLQQHFTPMNDITCSPISFTTSNFITNLLLAGGVMCFTALMVIAIPIMYREIFLHVKASNVRAQSTKAAENQKSIIQKAALTILINTSTWLVMFFVFLLSYLHMEDQRKVAMSVVVAIHISESINIMYYFHKFALCRACFKHI